MAALAITNPFLVKLVGAVIEHALKYAINQGEMGIYFHYIDTRVNKQAKEFEQAALENHRAQISGTPEEKLNAEKNLIAKFRAFVILSN